MSEHQIEKFGLWVKKSTKDEELARDVTRTNDHLRKLSLPRVEKEKRLMRLYASDPSGYTAELTAYLRRDRPEFNMIRQGVDTQIAQVVARQKYLPRYIVVDGSWSMGRTSRIRTRVMEGQTEDLNVAAEMAMAALDGYVLSSPGWLVGYLDGADKQVKPAIERCHPGEVLIDPHACVSGKSKLKRGHRRRAIPLEWLLEHHSKQASLIEASARATDRDREFMFLPKDNTCDDVRVDEVWSAGTKDKPGRHVICTNKAVLVDEPWPYDVPLIPVHYLKRQTGLIGMGLAELGQDEQIRLDRVLKCANAGDKIDSTIYIMAGFNQRFMAESVPGDETTRVFRTNAPQGTEFKAFRGTSAPLHAEAERIRERFLSLTGINQLDAEGKKPAGIISEPGQRTFADLAQRRQQQVTDNIKDAWKGVFEMLEQLNAYAQSKNSDFSIAARTTRGLVPLVNTVKWSDAQMESEEYRLSLQLVSDTPYQAGGRVEALQEWIKSGFTRRTFGQAQVMQGPNEDYQRRETADTDYACWMVERVLDGDFSVELDPYLIPEVAFDVFRTSYLPIKSDGAPEDVLGKLRQLIDTALVAIEAKKPMPGPVAPDGMYTPPEALQLQDMPQGAGGVPPTAPPMPAGPEMPMPMA
jgi:hypothetical protein